MQKIKEQKQGKATKYKEKGKQIQEQIKKLQDKEIILIRRGDISDFEDEEFYGFCNDFEQKEENSARIKKGNGR